MKPAYRNKHWARPMPSYPSLKEKRENSRAKVAVAIVEYAAAYGITKPYAAQAIANAYREPSVLDRLDSEARGMR